MRHNLEKLIEWPLEKYVERANCFNAIQLYFEDTSVQTYLGPEEFIHYLDDMFIQIPHQSKVSQNDVSVVLSRSELIIATGSIVLSELIKKSKGYHLD